MMGLRAAMELAGGAPAQGVRGSFHSYPASLRELIRICTLPQPRLADLENTRFLSFEEEDPQGIAFAHGERWFLSSQFRVSRYHIGGPDPYRPSHKIRERGD